MTISADDNKVFADAHLALNTIFEHAKQHGACNSLRWLAPNTIEDLAALKSSACFLTPTQHNIFSESPIPLSKSVDPYGQLQQYITSKQCVYMEDNYVKCLEVDYDDNKQWVIVYWVSVD